MPADAAASGAQHELLDLERGLAASRLEVVFPGIRLYFEGPLRAALKTTRAVGVLLILVGLPGLVDSFARFALQGLGTPAPVAPTKNLVVTGLYRYVRNPIYVAVVAIILGQAILFGDWRLVLLGALFWLAFHLFVVAYEEPTLQRTFGAEYEAYRANVQRWIPRVTPWRAPEAGSRQPAKK